MNMPTNLREAVMVYDAAMLEFIAARDAYTDARENVNRAQAAHAKLAAEQNAKSLIKPV